MSQNIGFTSFSVKRSSNHDTNCGICEQSGSGKPWYSPCSRWAHSSCLKKIETAESELTSTINKLFHDAADRDNAHYQAIKAIRAQCGEDTIKKHLSKNREEVLTKLFNSVGISSAQLYAETKKSNL